MPRGTPRSSPPQGRWRRASTSHIDGPTGRGQVPRPSLLHALIHPSAWKKYSRKFAESAFCELRVDGVLRSSCSVIFYHFELYALQLQPEGAFRERLVEGDIEDLEDIELLASQPRRQPQDYPHLRVHRQ